MKKHAVRPEKKSSETGPKDPPSVLQLPGGITVRSFDFRITAIDEHGCPTRFEAAKPGEPSDCVLWASERFMRSTLTPMLMSRYEHNVNPPDLVKQSRDLVPNSRCPNCFAEMVTTDPNHERCPACTPCPKCGISGGAAARFPCDCEVGTAPYEKVDSIGTCSRCGYYGPGPAHECVIDEKANIDPDTLQGILGTK